MVTERAGLSARLRGVRNGATMRERLTALSEHPALVVMVYALLALALRGLTLGSPSIQIDEQFYLLTGDRMLHGALPYVDIWDRKPVGLFVLFAAIRLLGGEGIYQYQLIALLSVVLTSLVIWRTARLIATPLGALCAGVAYQCLLSAFFCYGGQAPVYYNLPVALAGLWMARLLTRPSALFAEGLGVMLLIGLVLQIKYTVVFEGTGFGLALMWRAHRLGWSAGKVAVAAVGWAGMALAPTAAALGWYVAIGHGHDFIYANFLSIFGRHEPFNASLWRLTKEMVALTPVWLALFLAPRRMAMRDGDAPAALPFLRFWGLLSFGGFLLFGTWYDHYLAPVMVPVTILCAPAMGRLAPHRWYTWLLLGVAGIAAVAVPYANMHDYGSRADMDRMLSRIEAARGKGCLYVAEGDPMLYHLTHSCLPTRYAFPNHLVSAVDQGGLGVDTLAEARRIMDSRPDVVVITAQPQALPANWAVRNLLMQRLSRDYVLFAKERDGTRDFLIWQDRRLHHTPLN